jgi:hypothetical protein
MRYLLERPRNCQLEGHGQLECFGCRGQVSLGQAWQDGWKWECTKEVVSMGLDGISYGDV